MFQEKPWIRCKEEINAHEWKCPWCGRSSIIRSDEEYCCVEVYFSNNEKSSLATPLRTHDRGLIIDITTCPNSNCRKVHLRGHYGESNSSERGYEWAGLIAKNKKPFQFIPEVQSKRAKKQPIYIQDFIYEDYKEGCDILELSPKAASTLARRCLQTMIRDFFDIKKGRLVDEIDAIEQELDEQAVKAFHGVREIGNIGAHLKLDTDMMPKIVTKDEADALLRLIEGLFSNWYGTRYMRDQSMKDVIAIAEAKKEKPKDDGPEAEQQGTGGEKSN